MKKLVISLGIISLLALSAVDVMGRTGFKNQLLFPGWQIPNHGSTPGKKR